MKSVIDCEGPMKIRMCHIYVRWVLRLLWSPDNDMERLSALLSPSEAIPSVNVDSLYKG